jgi:hypothetical protein
MLASAGATSPGGVNFLKQTLIQGCFGSIFIEERGKQYE